MLLVITLKTTHFSQEFWSNEIRINRVISKYSWIYAITYNQYFEVLVDHKAIEYMVKSKTETPTTRLKTLLLKLSEYTIDLKYQKGSEMHTSDTLSRLHNLTDTPDNKDIIPLNFLQHLTSNYIEHAYSHWVENLYFHKTKDYDTTQVKRQCCRPPKQKLEWDLIPKTAANTHTT